MSRITLYKIEDAIIMCAKISLTIAAILSAPLTILALLWAIKML